LRQPQHRHLRSAFATHHPLLPPCRRFRPSIPNSDNECAFQRCLVQRFFT
jgi:hypothetical protein